MRVMFSKKMHSSRPRRRRVSAWGAGALAAAGLGAVLLLQAPRLAAVATVFWHSAGFQEFSQGQLNGVSLSQDGQLTIAPRLDEVFHSNQELVWTMAADAGGALYLATGHRGKIFRLTPAMLHRAPGSPPVTAEDALWFTAPEAEIFALAVGPDGALYAGSSPDGKVYRIAPDGKSSVYFDPQSKYIWSLAFSHDALFVGTGEDGEIFKVTAAGKGQKFLDTRQREVMALATDGAGTLLAGTEPGGLVYRIQADAQAFVLYHSELPEIHELHVAASGDIYVSAQGVGSTRRLPVAGGSPVHLASLPTANISVTVQGDAQQSGPVPGAAPPLTLTPIGPAPPAVVEPAGPATPTGALLSAIYRISPTGGVDTLWSSHRENADDVLPSAHGLLFSTDTDGRIYDLGSDHQATVLVQTQQEETTKLLAVGDSIYATTRDFGNLYRVGTAAGAEGTFASPVRDTQAISQWGDIRWQGNLPPGSISVYTRSGNSDRPDFTWSDWSTAYNSTGERITSPPARYIQWKAVLHRGTAAAPTLDEVVIPYLPANQAPTISAVRARVNEGDEAGGESGRGATVNRGIQLSWTAQDPDGDALTYDLYFEGQGETSWKELRSNLTQSQFTIASGMLPDGVYRFKVVASDGDANPPALTKTAEVVSAPLALDSTPPAVRVEGTETPGPGDGVAHFSAADSGSPLAKAEFAIDGGAWRDLLADSGIVDGPRLQFTVRGTRLSAGEHVLMLRVTDEDGNQGSAKAVLTVK